MTPDEQHHREMGMNAHFCWALAMWGSAELSRAKSSYIAACYTYYYAAFHAAFAWINTDHTFHTDDMRGMKHSKIESWLGDRLPLPLQQDHALLRDCREATSYLGMGTPASKLAVVRGHPFLVERGSGSPMTFFDAISEASHASSRIISHVLEALEKHCAASKWRGPRRNDSTWLDEYLQEDVLLTVVPRTDDGRAILTYAFSLLK